MIYTAQTLADHWQVSRNFIYSLIHKGELKASKLGGKLLRIKPEWVEEYERCQITGSANLRGDSSSPGTGRTEEDIAGDLMQRLRLMRDQKLGISSGKLISNQWPAE